jgi:proteasome assembly chaperone (PAC2) family protein
MLYREIIDICSQIHTKHINTLCGENVEFVNVKLVVHIVTNGLQRVKTVTKTNQFMLYRIIIAVCSKIHTKHINTLRGLNVDFVNVKLVVHIVTVAV